LRFEDGIESVDALELNDDFVLDDEINSVLADLDAFVLDREQCLTLKRDVPLVHFNAHCRLISILEQPGAEPPMNLDRATDNLLGQRVDLLLELEIRNQRCAL
jgi:hypothetical protein